MFLETLLSPPHCQVVKDSIPTNGGGGGETGEEEEEEMPEMETMTENTVSVRMYDKEGGVHYASNNERIKGMPVTVIINDSERRVSAEFPRFNYIDIKTT
jgi:hypothetical protein